MFGKLISTWQLLGGIYLGWGIGANDSANIFGTAVATKVIKWLPAAIIISVFAILGAALQGAGTVEFVKTGLGEIKNINQAFIASFSAAMTIMILTIMGVPSSTSQATAGAIIGMTIAVGGSRQWDGIIKAVICWVATPIGAAFFAVILYYIFKKITKKIKNVILLNKFIKISTIVAGALASYSLGANNAGNATGYFFFGDGKYGGLLANSQYLSAIAGLAMAFGALTYSKKVMLSIGKGITVLTPLTSLIAVLAQGITVWIFAFVGVPVSVSQAVVGAILGLGILKGMQTVSWNKLIQIFIGWISTPISAGIVAYFLIRIVNYFNLEFF